MLSDPLTGLAGVVEVHEVIDDTPVTAQVPAPVGDAPLVGPVTVAVNVIDAPTTPEVPFGETDTVGVATPTVVSLVPVVDPVEVL